MKATFFFTAFFLLFSFFSSGNVSAQTSKTKKPKAQVITIKTNAKCDMCKAKIEAAVLGVKGVKSAVLDGTNHAITVSFRPDKTTGDAIRQSISKAGYSADGFAADASAQEKLPKCCK